MSTRSVQVRERQKKNTLNKPIKIFHFLKKGKESEVKISFFIYYKQWNNFIIFIFAKIPAFWGLEERMPQ